MKIIELQSIDLLTALLVGEAAREDVVGKMAVACVVMNRVNDSRWPNNYQDVILQAKQFSCFNKIPRHNDIPEPYYVRFFKQYYDQFWWRECRFVAFGVVYNYFYDITNGCNHYYAPGLCDTPSWAENIDPVWEYGGHLFFKL